MLAWPTRDGDAGPGSLAPAQGLDSEIAAQQCGAFAHAQQAHRPRVGNFLPADAAPIIFDFQNNARRLFFQLHIHVGSFRMANHVSERFLENTKKGGGEFGIQSRAAQMG